MTNTYLLLYNIITEKRGGSVKKFLVKKKFVVLLSVFLIILLSAVLILMHLNSNSAGKLSDICPDLLKDGIEGKVKWISTEIKTPNSFVSTAKDSQKIKKALSELEISTNPVSDDKSLNRDKTVSIAFEEMTDDYSTYAYSEIIYFNADFTEVWIYNEGIPTYTYKVINPEKAKEITEKDYKGDFDISETSLVSEVFPELTDEKKHKYTTLWIATTHFYELFSSSNEVYEDMQNLKISKEPIDKELYDKSEAVSIIEFAFSWADDYYYPKYKYEFCFNKDKTELWVVVDDEKGYKYKVYEPQKVEDMLNTTCYNFSSAHIYDSPIDELYIHSESVKDVTLKFNAALLPKLGSEMFEDCPNNRKTYYFNKYEGFVYSENNTKMKITEISHSDKSDFVTIDIAIENTIPENGEVIYGKYADFEKGADLSKLQRSNDIKCGDTVYEGAFEVPWMQTMEIQAVINKDVYSKLYGEIEIILPMISMNLEKK